MTILLISPITQFVRALRSSSALFVASVALLLSACTTLPETTNQPVDWVSHQNQLESLHEYALTGKMAYISESKRQSLNFYWKKLITQKNFV